MRDSLAFDILTCMMSEDWRADSPIPSTSQGDLDSLFRLEGEDASVAPIIQLEGEVAELAPETNLLLDPAYEETLQSLYSEDSASDPLWTPSTVSPTLGGDTSIDFLSDDCFMDASMTSVVVKEELKTRIKAKRLASGQDDVPVDPPQKQESSQNLSEEDLKLREQRREKNRLAAQKCRNKKRERADVLENDIDRLENKQDKLKAEIQRLQDEREHLEGVIEVHGMVCPKIRKLDKS